MLRACSITFLLFTALGVGSSGGQIIDDGGSARGIVWTPPSGPFAEVRGEMEQIRNHGADAVRIPLVLDRNVHVVADMFGLSLYQEIDARFLPVQRLAERKDALIAALDSALTIASAMNGRYRFGLGYGVDTSVPEACAIIEELGSRVHARLPEAKTYYVSTFIESDSCSHVVDFVLLDARGESSAEALIRRWRLHSDTPVGISGIGYPVRDNADGGYLNRYSPEYQARMLEEELTVLLADSALEAVFVDRWQSGRRSAREEHVDYPADYGIVAPNDKPRPSAAVVRGLYSGAQRVFSFDAGAASGDDYSWINLISFLSVALFGLTYYGSIGLRSVVRRYFLSHAIYIEKLHDGRETSIGTSMFLLLCLSMAASVVGMVVLTDLTETRLWFPILAWAPASISDVLSAGAATPVMLIPVFASLFALVTLLWAGLLSVSTGGSRNLRFGQALLVAVLPRWPVALIGLLALVILNWRIDAPGFALIVMIGIWFFVVLIYSGRMFSDFLRLLGIRLLWTVPVLFLGLMLVAGAVWLIVVTNDFQPEFEYLWHLASRA